MIKNYFKIAWRNILKNKVFSIVNIVGLTSGLFCSLLIYLWISGEMSTDKYHKNIDQLYSVYVTSSLDGKMYGNFSTPSLLHKELKIKVPEIELVTAMSNNLYKKTFSNGEKVLKQEGKYVSEDFFSMFSFNFIEGTQTNALSAPNFIAVSKEMAEIFYESANKAIGKTLIFENKKEYKISAVFETSNSNSTEKSDYYLSFNSLFAENPWMNEWKNYSPYTIIQLKEGTDPGKLENKIKNFLTDYDLEQGLSLQPYGDKYLYADVDNDSGRIEYVRIFGIIAILIMLIACVNFMNLASASSMKRTKEIGVRKVLGAGKISLMIQFLTEATLLSLSSLFFALLLIVLALPAFNQITDKNISLMDLPISTWFMFLTIAIFTGLLSGSYPAFMLSSFRVTDIFKRKFESNGSTKWIREGLIVFQFTISVVFICSMIIISQQLDFVKNKDVGFDRQNLLAITLSGELLDNFDAFKSEALQFSGVNSITKVSHIPLGEYGTSPEVIWNGKSDDDKSLFTGMVASPDFIETYGVELIQGRGFIHNNPDNIEYIINETALKLMNLENPIGQSLSFWGKPGTIVGIVKDFHFSSLKESIFPLVLRSEGYAEFFVAFVRYNPNHLKQTLASLSVLHADLNPSFPFEYKFIDQEYNKLYKSETIFYKLTKYFSILAILISCLGLFGLVIFTAEQRTKEIGVRKILGASVFTITSLITRDFLKLVVLGILIGSPIAWYIMDKWLINFEYKINMPWWAFGLTSILIIGIALFTISFESIKAGLSNPIKSLRTE
jgi:putative ABC transport system permease protein